MEAVYWIAFNLPAIETEWDEKNRYWYEINGRVYDVFSEPRTYWPSYEILEGIIKSSYSKIPPYPVAPDVQAVFFLRPNKESLMKKNEDGRSVIVQEAVDAGDLKKLEEYRSAHKEVIANYHVEMEAHADVINHLIKKAKIKLLNSLLVSEIVARGTLSGKLKAGRTGHLDDDWIDVEKKTFDKINEGSYQRRFKGAVARAFDDSINMGEECPFDDMDENAALIHKSAWAVEGVNWDECTLKSNGSMYSEIHFDKEALFKTFPPETGADFKGMVKSGVFFYEGQLENVVKYKKVRGAPRQYDDLYFARKTKELHSNGYNTQASIVKEVGRLYEEVFKVQIPENTLREKVSKIIKEIINS